jgi:hypothetical protein
MRHDPVGQRRVGCCSREHRARNGRIAFSSMCPDVSLSGLARRQFRSRDHRSKRVENVVLCFFCHIVGQRAAPGSSHVGA